MLTSETRLSCIFWRKIINENVKINTIQHILLNATHDQTIQESINQIRDWGFETTEKYSPRNKDFGIGCYENYLWSWSLPPNSCRFDPQTKWSNHVQRLSFHFLTVISNFRSNLCMILPFHAWLDACWAGRLMFGPFIFLFYICTIYVMYI